VADLNAYQQASVELQELAGPRFLRFTVSGKDAAVGQEGQPHEVYVEGRGTVSGKTLADAVAAAKRLMTGEPVAPPAPATTKTKAKKK